MERWVLIVGVVAIFPCLAAMGRYFDRGSNLPGLCTTTEQQCTDDTVALKPEFAI